MWSSVGRERRGMQTSNSDQNISSESSHTCSVNSPLEDCHAFYFKIPCPLCVPLLLLTLLCVWRVEMKTKHPGTGLSDCKSFTFTNFVIMDK